MRIRIGDGLIRREQRGSATKWAAFGSNSGQTVLEDIGMIGSSCREVLIAQPSTIQIFYTLFFIARLALPIAAFNVFPRRFCHRL